MGRLGTYSDRHVSMITGPQLSFLESLTREMFDLTSTITGDDVTADRETALALLPTMSKAAASDRIGSLKTAILPVMRQTARGMYNRQSVESPVSAPAPVELDTDGIYVVDGSYYRVRRSQAGNLYALKLDTASRRWEYVRGMVRQIAPAHRITAEHAARLPFSWCIRCARELSREDSIARRMGPVCFSKSVG